MRSTIALAVVLKARWPATYSRKEIQKDPSKDPKLLPGDQVIIPE